VIWAERQYQVPDELLVAIAGVESSFDRFAINGDGISYHPESLAAAKTLVRTLQRLGVRYIDVGCMQIDLKHHPNAFATLDDAFDPEANAIYGAWYLASLANKYGSWPEAVAWYHAGGDSWSGRIAQADYLRSVAAALTGSTPKARPTSRQASSSQRQTMRTARLSTMIVTRPADDDAPGIYQWSGH
jgi:soluble lytic murein transglycosylase-like protein